MPPGEKSTPPHRSLGSGAPENVRPQGPLANQRLECEPGLLRAPPSHREEEAKEEVGGKCSERANTQWFPSSQHSRAGVSRHGLFRVSPAPQEGKLTGLHQPAAKSQQPWLLLQAQRKPALCAPVSHRPHWERSPSQAQPGTSPVRSPPPPTPPPRQGPGAQGPKQPHRHSFEPGPELSLALEQVFHSPTSRWTDRAPSPKTRCSGNPE